MWKARRHIEGIESFGETWGGGTQDVSREGHLTVKIPKRLKADGQIVRKVVGTRKKKAEGNKSGSTLLAAGRSRRRVADWG